VTIRLEITNTDPTRSVTIRRRSTEDLDSAAFDHTPVPPGETVTVAVWDGIRLEIEEDYKPSVAQPDLT
jgi:hypothetical protein